jgi:hypothetical protein
LVKIGQKYWALFKEPEVCFTVAGDTNSPKNHFCATINIVILLRVSFISTIHIKIIVAFHCNKFANEPQCYVTRTLSILFFWSDVNDSSNCPL